MKTYKYQDWLLLRGGNYTLKLPIERGENSTSIKKVIEEERRNISIRVNDDVLRDAENIDTLFNVEATALVIRKIEEKNAFLQTRIDDLKELQSGLSQDAGESGREIKNEIKELEGVVEEASKHVKVYKDILDGFIKHVKMKDSKSNFVLGGVMEGYSRAGDILESLEQAIEKADVLMNKISIIIETSNDNSEDKNIVQGILSESEDLDTSDLKKEILGEETEKEYSSVAENTTPVITKINIPEKTNAGGIKKAEEGVPLSAKRPSPPIMK